jgi:hypothetical protein
MWHDLDDRAAFETPEVETEVFGVYEDSGPGRDGISITPVNRAQRSQLQARTTKRITSRASAPASAATVRVRVHHLSIQRYPDGGQDQQIGHQ